LEVANERAAKRKSRESSPASQETNCAFLLTLWRERVKHAPAQWRKEAQRLFAEYRRTGNMAHLKAFRVHRAAMGARLRGRLKNQ
jgi:hypothetical protein